MRKNEGFTLIELLIVVAIIGIIAAIAVPGLMRARMSGNESSAIGSLRAINSAESTYASSCARGGYASTLEALAKPPVGSTSAFISPDLATNGVTKSGYLVTAGVGDGAAGTTVITPAAQTCNAAATDAVAGYFAESHPATIGTTGQRSFGTDTRGTLFFDVAGAAFTAATVAGAATTQALQ